MFGKSAELAGNLLKKGQLVFTEGKLQSRNWEDKDGVKRYTTEVVCEIFTMLGRKMDNENNQSPGSVSRPEQKTENTPDDEDLPF
jgi:single-strand DNA-binding protein